RLRAVGLGCKAVFEVVANLKQLTQQTLVGETATAPARAAGVGAGFRCRRARAAWRLSVRRWSFRHRSVAWTKSPVQPPWWRRLRCRQAPARVYRIGCLPSWLQTSSGGRRGADRVELRIFPPT